MFNKKENGQVAIIVAFALVALLVFAILAIDGGNAYSARRNAQNAADAAAMAGARQIILECNKGAGADENAILVQTQSMALANAPGATVKAYFIKPDGSLYNSQVGAVGGVPCGCTANRAVGVRAIVDTSTQSFLAGLIGQSSLKVQGQANARFGQVAQPGTGVYPLTRRNVPIEFGQLITLRILDNADEAPGAFGWLTWDGTNNVPTLAESLEPPGNSATKYYNIGTPEDNWTAIPSDHQLAVGKWTQSAPGNKNSSQVRGQLDDHFMPGANPRHIMILPLYDAVVGQGSHVNYRVASFAAFWLEDYDFTGQDKSATGKFIKWVTNGDWAQGVSCANESGMYAVKLVP
jgi:hypothetical protein